MADNNSAKILVDFASSGTYPSSSDFEADLQPQDAVSARAELSKAQADARAQVTKISRSVGPDVDGWIAQAQQLQRDIEHSKTIAREVVEEARRADELRAARDEAQQKAGLLEIEVGFNQRVQASLQHAKDAATSLACGQEALKEGKLLDVLKHLKSGDAHLSGLAPLRSTTAVELLSERSARLRQRLEEEAVAQWDTVISIDGNKLNVSAGDDVASSVDLLSKLKLTESRLLQVSRSIDRCIVTPRLRRHSGPSNLGIICNGRSCELKQSNSSEGPESQVLLEELTSFVDFLNDNLSPQISTRISEDLMPSIANRLISDWLHESIPTSLDHSESFESLLKAVTAFTEHLASVGWHGGAELNDWVEQAPKEWLAKRRENALISVRDILTNGVKVTKEVERVETQMVSKAEVMPNANGGNDDDWGAAWGEDDHASTSNKEARSDAENDEDGSAWDVGSEPASQSDVQEQAVDTNGKASEGSHDDEDAWGWEDQHSPTSSKHAPAVKTNGAHSAGDHDNTQERELTLKEKFTITAVPDELLSIITMCIDDATALQGEVFNNSTIQPAATGLYSLPTLILAGYRSLAPSFYTSVNGGNMYLYNDCMRLNTSLTSFAANMKNERPLASRRSKLDDDIEALTSFGKRAYGKEMESQRTILRDLLDGAQGFTNCTEAPYARECENAVAMTVDRLRTVAAEWKPILSHSALLQSMGSLLSTVANKILIDVLDLGDISEAESTRLRELCDKIATLSDLFTEQSGAEDAQKSDMTAIYTPDWFRFQYLGEILEGNLADIRYMWQEEGLKLEFQAGEVIELVEALFADSDRRRQAIAEIRRG